MNYGALPDWVLFCNQIVPVIQYHGGWVYSWGRSATRNKDVGGMPASRHLHYCGMDVGFYSETQRDSAYRDCYARGLHGYKKGPWKDPGGQQVWGFHMQDRPGAAK